MWGIFWRWRRRWEVETGLVSHLTQKRSLEQRQPEEQDWLQNTSRINKILQNQIRAQRGDREWGPAEAHARKRWVRVKKEGNREKRHHLNEQLYPSAGRHSNLSRRGEWDRIELYPWAKKSTCFSPQKHSPSIHHPRSLPSHPSNGLLTAMDSFSLNFWHEWG